MHFFDVLILTKGFICPLLTVVRKKKRPCHSPLMGFDRVVWCFLLGGLPPSLVSAFYSFLSAGYVHAPWQSVERLVHACALCAPAHQAAVKRVHVHVCLLAGIVGGYCPYAGRVLAGHVVDSVLAARHRG